jgi:hypothetical protein
MKKEYSITFSFEKSHYISKNLKIMLLLVTNFKCLDKFIEHVIIKSEIPFGFLIINVILKNEKSNHDNFSSTTT